MPPRRICVVTGSRADYGLLYWPMRMLRDDPAFELQLVVTGMHLAQEFGSTVEAIEADGFSVSARVDMLLSGDTPVAVTKSVGLGVVGFADALERLRPDWMLVLGDRFEILAAVQAALFARIPVAHLCGGDVTEGAFDEAIRHAITKMAHLHFATNSAAERRLLQMGERRESVHNVGSTGLDRIRRMDWMERPAVFDAIGLEPRRRNLLVTFHPITLDDRASVEQLEALLEALDGFGDDTGLILTGPNADTEGRSMTARLEDFAEGHDNAVFRMSLGQELYLNTLAQVEAVIGNSSSGLYEAPSFKIPTVNIGDRQKGRLSAASVVDCEPESGAITDAIDEALQRDCSDVINPYGDGDSSARIIAVLKSIDDPASLVRKSFQDVIDP